MSVSLNSDKKTRLCELRSNIFFPSNSVVIFRYRYLIHFLFTFHLYTFCFVLHSFNNQILIFFKCIIVNGCIHRSCQCIFCCLYFFVCLIPCINFATLDRTIFIDASVVFLFFISFKHLCMQCSRWKFL